MLSGCPMDGYVANVVRLSLYLQGGQHAVQH